MEHRSDQGTGESLREPIHRGSIFGNKFSRVLREFKHFAKRPSIVLEQDGARSGIGHLYLEIDENAVCRCPSLLIKDDRYGAESENLAGNCDVAAPGNQIVAGLSNQFEAYGIRKTLFDPVGRGPILKCRDRNRSSL